MITTKYIDPSPRQYPEFVHLLGRANRGPAAAGNATTLADLEDWLLGDAINEQNMLTLLESLSWRMVAAGLPVVRTMLSAGTLHPQMVGFSWNWQKADGLCDEIVVKAMSTETDAYLKSPLRAPIEEGEPLLLDTRIPENRERYPILQELYEQGIKHYYAIPLPKRAGARRYDVTTIATDAEEGFTEEQTFHLERIRKFLALHVHRLIARRISENVLDVYLGSNAGKMVLDGTIKRGEGSAIKAVVLFADMRSFTELSEKFTAPQVNTLLNHFFDKLVGAVTSHGGDVLKFLGDGILAVFPYESEKESKQAANAAMAAADQALKSIEAFNAKPPECVSDLKGWQPLRCGIALHSGEVFFGNVGGSDRLDFTVIGSVVNEASRLETLTKRLLRPVLMSEEVANWLKIPVDDMGHHELKGFAEHVRVFAPKHWKSSAIRN